MKPTFINLTLILAIITGAACKRESQKTLLFTNTLDADRSGEVVVLENNKLTNLIGEFPENKLPVFISGKDTLTSQLIDLNNDGIPEEILVEISLLSKETKEVSVKFTEKKNYPDFRYKTNLRFASKKNTADELNTATRVQTTDTEITSAIFQMEGPAWENDKVGFRNYFDLRNGMDIFGKRTSEMVLDGVGLTGSYHELSDWGMDILKVGNSLGAGAIGVAFDGKLFRIGDNGNGTFERMYEGPLRNEFRFDFPDWAMGSANSHISQYVSITAGQYAYRSVVFADELPEDAYLIAGIVNMLSDELFVEKAGEHVILYTHSRQAEDGKCLAMALIIPEEYLIGEEEAPGTGPGIIQTNYAKMGLAGKKEALYYFYSLWETSDPNFADPDFVKEYLVNEALKLNTTIKVSRIR